MRRQAKTDRPRLPKGMIFKADYNSMGHQARDEFKRAGGGFVVMTTLQYDDMLRAELDLGERMRIAKADCDRKQLATECQIAGLKEDHARTIKRLEDRHSEEINDLRARIDEWRGRFAAAKLFIATLLKGEL